MNVQKQQRDGIDALIAANSADRKPQFVTFAAEIYLYNK